MSQVLLGPQARLKEGVLELTLFPGRLGHIELSNGTSPKANARNAIPLDLGDVINLRDLEQALENLNRLPSVESRIELSAADGPEAEPGQSDLIVHWKQSAPWRANLSFDDAGSKTTGKYQAGLTLAYDHLLGSRAKAEATAGPMEPVDTRFIIQCLWVTGFRTGSELFLVKSPPRPS